MTNKIHISTNKKQRLFLLNPLKEKRVRSRLRKLTLCKSRSLQIISIFGCIQGRFWISFGAHPLRRKLCMLHGLPRTIILSPSSVAAHVLAADREFPLLHTKFRLLFRSVLTCRHEFPRFGSPGCHAGNCTRQVFYLLSNVERMTPWREPSCVWSCVHTMCAQGATSSHATFCSVKWANADQDYADHANSCPCHGQAMKYL